MIARNKPAVDAGVATELPPRGRNRGNFVRVPDSYRTFSRGWAFRPKGQDEQAIEHLKAAAATLAGKPEFQVQIGQAAFRLQDLAMAERSFAAAVALDPDLAAARTGLAAVALERHDWPATERHALAAIAIDFQTPLAHLLLADARLRQGRFAEADTALQVACRLAGDWLPAREMRARLWSGVHGHPNKASTEADLAAAIVRGEARAARRAEFLDTAHQSARRLLADTYALLGAQTARRLNARPADRPEPCETIVLVSGLPRSGTSLVMQMLARGGAPILTDGHREADADNPEGYLEWKPLLRLPQHPEVLRLASGRVLKLLTPMVPYLPRRYQYRVIFLERPIDEVVASQLAMRQRAGRPGHANPLKMRAALASHGQAALKHLREAARAEVLVVPYPALISNPVGWAARMATMLGPDIVRYPDLMADAVHPELYRQRDTTPDAIASGLAIEDAAVDIH
jgi:tetratricopeptide (TPR) repeat protein